MFVKLWSFFVTDWADGIQAISVYLVFNGNKIFKQDIVTNHYSEINFNPHIVKTKELYGYLLQTVNTCV